MLFDVLVTGFLRRNALRSLLSALGVALGVAIATMFAAVASTTGDELDRTFRTIGSATNLEVIGSRTGFDQHVLVAVSRIAGVDLAAPIVEGQATIGSRDRDLVNIVGVDALRSFPREVEIRAEVPGPFAPSGRDPAAGALLAPGAVVVSAAFARRHGLVEGSTIAVSAPRRVTLRVAGVVTRPLVGYDSNAVFADIRTAQAVLGMPNRLGRIDCVVDPAYLQQVEATARGSLPAGMRVVEPGDPFEDVRRVFDNVRTCLAILSSLSLALCGVLIYNAVGVSVHQRRPQIGVLRTMGVGRGAIFRTFLLEGTMLGTVGAVYGLIVTVAAAPLVSRWFTVQLDVGTLLAIAAAGVVMAIGASIVPAYRASAEPPALAVRGPERQPSPRAGRASIVTATAAAGAAAAAAFVALLHPGVGIATGTVTAVLVAALAALPLGVRTATSRLRAATRNLSGSERLAAINVGTPPGRAALTVATFAVAVATIVCAAVVIDSSRSTVTLWARRTHAAELTVTGAPFDLRAIERVRGIEGVADVVRTRDELDVSPTPSANLSRLRVEVVAALAPQPVEIVTSGELRRHLGEVFGAVFAATSALAALAAALGIGGVVGSLMAVVLERREELALLRYLGLSRAALRTLLLAEALFVATLGGGLGTVLGFGFAAVLLFGSHTVEAGGALRWSPSYPSIAAALLFAVAAVLAGALIPARMAARIRTDEVLQST